jgi:polysaccharide deacetylase family protein (PEP-CTERM system associated)
MESQTNILTIDLEDYLLSIYPFKSWDTVTPRVENNTRILLDLLRRHKVHATFFVLGWIAEKFPDLVRRIASDGHEIASHGYSHKCITEMTPDELRFDLDKALKVTSPLSTEPVIGYRAPSFTITEKTWWAVAILKELGFQYDSSIFPVGFHPDYGIKEASLNPFITPEGIMEIPLSCIEVAGKRIPCTGGAYFRLLPYWLNKILYRECIKQGRRLIFYLHPWEIDNTQPRVMSLPWQKRIRHYWNLDKTLNRFDRLLSDFSFSSIREVICPIQH